jgi:hypothetical protein
MAYITKLIPLSYFPFNNPNLVSLHAITDAFFSLHKNEIIQALSAVHPDVDWNTYEEGIDDWFGWGSVFAYELGLKFVIELGDKDGISVSIEGETL